MFEISVNPSVLQALEAAFPLPLNTARRALTKYIKTLERLLFESVQFGRTPEQCKFNTYSISLQKLANLGGQIGSNRTRVHAWLRSNDLELVQTVVNGSNLTGRVSDVKLTELVNLINQLVPQQEAIELFSTDTELQNYLDGVNAHKIKQLIYPDSCSGDIDLESSKYEPLEVDQDSLRSYILWVTDKSTLLSSADKDHALKQARIVLTVSKSTNGIYYQRKKPSQFGRMYYEGISIQNVNRELRRAILGDCWEYDIRSSVIAWKMGFAQEYLASIGKPTELTQIFQASIGYLENKDDFMKTIRHFVFVDGANIDSAFQKKLLKKAITAISFGARATGIGWQDVGGHWRNPALVDILKNPEDRSRFLGDVTIRKFIQEQNTLDDYIFRSFKSEASDLTAKAFLQTPSGRISKSKVLAFCYQHGETTVMDIVRSVAATYNRYPLASVHDAIFFRAQLGADLKHEIELQMQERTENPYWKLSATKLDRYLSIDNDDKADVQAHKARIASEELDALDYRSHWVSD